LKYFWTSVGIAASSPINATLVIFTNFLFMQDALRNNKSLPIIFQVIFLPFKILEIDKISKNENRYILKCFIRQNSKKCNKFWNENFHSIYPTMKKVTRTLYTA